MLHAEATEELLVHLLEVCRLGSIGAEQLATRARTRELQTLLAERARQYGQAEQELRERLPDWHTASDETPVAMPPAGSDRDISAQWELAECSALIQFRDAYDASLPSDVRETVRRQLEEGVRALERLRAFNMREWSPVAPRDATAPRVRLRT